MSAHVPDFSGTWVVVPSRSVWVHDGNPINITVFGERFTAEQTPQTLSIAIDNERGFKWIYRLDGAASTNAVPIGSRQELTFSSVAWHDKTLHITTTVSVTSAGASGQPELRRTIRFNDDGTLRVEASWGPNRTMIGSVYSRQR